MRSEGPTLYMISVLVIPYRIELFQSTQHQPEFAALEADGTEMSEQPYSTKLRKNNSMCAQPAEQGRGSSCSVVGMAEAKRLFIATTDLLCRAFPL